MYRTASDRAPAWHRLADHRNPDPRHSACRDHRGKSATSLSKSDSHPYWHHGPDQGLLHSADNARRRVRHRHPFQHCRLSQQSCPNGKDPLHRRPAPQSDRPLLQHQIEIRQGNRHEKNSSNASVGPWQKGERERQNLWIRPARLGQRDWLARRCGGRRVYNRNPCPGTTRPKDAMPANPAGATFIAAPIGHVIITYLSR